MGPTVYADPLSRRDIKEWKVSTMMASELTRANVGWMKDASGLTEDIVEEADLGCPSSLVRSSLVLGEHERLAGVEAPVDRVESCVVLGDGQDPRETEQVERRSARLHDQLVGKHEER